MKSHKGKSLWHARKLNGSDLKLIWGLIVPPGHLSGKGGHTTCGKNLRNVCSWMVEKMPSLNGEYKVCDRCWKMLYQLQFDSNNIFLEQEDDPSNETDSGNEIYTYSKETAVQSLNESLQIVGETYYSKTKAGEKIFGIPSDEGTLALPAGPDSILLQQLKEKLSETTNRSVKVTISTLLKDWNIRKIEE
jgi:hypothetical protein